MSTAELIYERAKSLPSDLQAEALHYLEYLAAAPAGEDRDGRDWSAFSATQLAAHYAPEDAVYDED